MCTSAFSIAGGRLGDTHRFCTFAGYIFATSIWTQHLWNLSIAVITYMILVRPLSSIIHRVEKHLALLWPTFWAISLVVNGVAWGVVGFGDVGGYCSFDPQRGGPLFSAIFQFVPRATVVVIIIVLYTHLFFFLRRTNLFSKAASRTSRPRGTGSGTGSSPLVRSGAGAGATDSQGARSGAGTGPEGDVAGHPRSTKRNEARDSQHGSFILNQAADTNSTLGGSVTFFKHLLTPSSKRRSSEATSSGHARSASTQDKASDAPRGAGYDDIEMVATQGYVNGAGSSNDAVADVIGNHGDEDEEIEVNEKGSPSTLAPSPSDIEASPRELEPLGTAPILAPSAVPKLQNKAHASVKRPSTAGSAKTHDRPHIVIPPRPSTGAGPIPSRSMTQEEADDTESVDSNYDTWLRKQNSSSSPFQTMTPRRDVRDFGMTSAPREHLKHYSLTPSGVESYKRALETGTPSPVLPCSPVSRRVMDASTPRDQSPAARRQTEANTASLPVNDPICTTKETTETKPAPSNPTYEEVLGDDWTWGMAVSTPGGGERRQGVAHRSLATPTASSLDATGAARQKGWWHGLRGTGGAKRRDGSNGVGSNETSSSESTGVHGVESLGSTLNRQASVLLLLYPAVYCLLFSISIIRIIVDLAGPSKDAAGVRGKQDDALHAISRWTIFAQGMIDAVVFQVVERQFRRRMKRKRRIAAGEQVEDVMWYKAVQSAWTSIRGGSHRRDVGEK